MMIKVDPAFNLQVVKNFVQSVFAGSILLEEHQVSQTCSCKYYDYCEIYINLQLNKPKLSGTKMAQLVQRLHVDINAQPKTIYYRCYYLFDF